jgi:hypothetical protein
MGEARHGGPPCASVRVLSPGSLTFALNCESPATFATPPVHPHRRAGSRALRAVATQGRAKSGAGAHAAGQAASRHEGQGARIRTWRCPPCGSSRQRGEVRQRVVSAPPEKGATGPLSSRKVGPQDRHTPARGLKTAVSGLPPGWRIKHRATQAGGSRGRCRRRPRRTQRGTPSTPTKREPRRGAASSPTICGPDQPASFPRMSANTSRKSALAFARPCGRRRQTQPHPVAQNGQKGSLSSPDSLPKSHATLSSCPHERTTIQRATGETVKEYPRSSEAGGNR